MLTKEYANEGIDFKKLAFFLQKRILIILVLTVLGGFLGGVVYQMVKAVKMPVEYSGVSKEYISFNADPTGETYQYYNGYTWNELLDSDPIIECVMPFLVGYTEDEVREASKGEIISDIRLLTVTITGPNEKFVREIQSAYENGLIIYANKSEEIKYISTVRTIAPSRVYWEDKTTVTAVFVAVSCFVIGLLCVIFSFIFNDAYYVVGDIRKRYSYKALGIMTRDQKGMEPYNRELKTDILYTLKDNKNLVIIDVDNHAEVRAQDFEKLLNWREAGILQGDENIGGELTWHVSSEDEDDWFDFSKEKEWNIYPLNENSITAENCEMIRKIGGAVLLVPFGNTGAPKRLNRLINHLNNVECGIYGIIITEADDDYIAKYYS